LASAFADDDGKYRPEKPSVAEPTTTATIRPFTFTTTTKLPIYKYNDPRYWNENVGRNWPQPNHRYNPYEPVVATRFDGKNVLLCK